MHTLLRPTAFTPEPWAAADLDSAADHWLWLYDRGPAAAGTAAEHWAAVRLRGFPRADVDAISAAISERLPGWQVRRPDPDTITAVAPARSFDAPPPHGLGVPRLAGPLFDGLYAEARLRAVGDSKTRRPAVDSTLVLAGELRGGELGVYAVWREGQSELVSNAMTTEPWPHGADWRADLARHRADDHDDVAARKLAAQVFPAVKTDRSINRVVWLISLPPWGKPRLGGTMLRLAVNLALAAGGVGLLLLALWFARFARARGGVDAWALYLAVVPAAIWALLGVGSLVLFVWQTLSQWVRIKRFATATFAQMYSDPTRMVPTDGATAAAVLDNPNGRKAAADWEAAGCRLLGDTVLEPLYREGAIHRVYAAPDGVTYVGLTVTTRTTAADGTVTQHIWPAAVNPVLTTRFPAGGSASTATDPALGFRRKRSGPEVAGQILPDVSAPADLLARHAELVRRHAEATGHNPLPAQPLAGFCRWQDERMAEERELYGPNPVTWADAFVVLMCRIRRAHRAG